jgi:hypothetical protein
MEVIPGRVATMSYVASEEAGGGVEGKGDTRVLAEGVEGGERNERVGGGGGERWRTGGEERAGMGARRQWPESGRRPRLGWVDGGGGMAGPKKMSTVAVSRGSAYTPP